MCGSDIDRICAPLRKCPGVRDVKSEGSCLRIVSFCELITASNRIINVVKLTVSRYFLEVGFEADFHKPPN